MANIFGNSSGYSTQPTSMMQFSTKNEWMAQGADVWFPDSWKMEGFKKIFLPFLRKNFVNKLLLLFFFFKGEPWPCWQWFTLQAFLAGVCFCWLIGMSFHGTFPDDDYQHHIISVHYINVILVILIIIVLSIISSSASHFFDMSVIST